MATIPKIEPWMIDGRRVSFVSTTISDRGFSEPREAIVMIAEDCVTGRVWGFFPHGGRGWEYQELETADAARAGSGFVRLLTGLHVPATQA